MRFAALGRTNWLYDSVLACVNEGHEAVLIGTCAAAPEYSVKENDFKKLANKLKCPYFCDPNLNAPMNLKKIRMCGAEVAISVNWLSMIGQEILDQFPRGIVNAHAGDLPRYRGNACPNWAILNNESNVVVTLHKMSQNLDAGPILLQRSIPVNEDTYIQDIYRFMAENIPRMFIQLLDGFSTNAIDEKHQSHKASDSLRCFPRIPQDGEIHWDRPAEELARLVRASSRPFVGAYTFLGQKKMAIWRAYAEKLKCTCLGVPGQVIEVRRETGEVAVLTGQGLLVMQEIQIQKGASGAASKFIRSTRTRLGLDVGAYLMALEDRMIRIGAQLRRK